MGSLFTAETPAPTPPAPPSSMRDEINGVEQVPVTNADGSITYMTRSLPLTAEQQAEKDQLDAIMAESLVEIKKLSGSDYAADEETQRVLSQWEETQTKLLAKQVAQRSRSEEETLARRGLSDSSAAQDVRRQRVLDQQDAEQNVNLRKDEMASQVRNEKLTLQQNLYNLAATATDSRAARTAQAAANAQSGALALNAQRQASLLDYYSGAGSNNAFGTAFGSSLGSALGKTAVSTATGGMSGMGGMLGSLFLRG